MVRVWRLDNQTDGFHCEAMLSGHTRFVTSCCFSNNGDFIISGSNDRSVRVWKLNGGPGDANPDGDDARFVHSDVGSRQENRFQASLTRQQEKVGKPVRLNGHSSDVNSCAFNGFLLATGSADKTVRVWKLAADSSWIEVEFSPLLGHSYSVYSVAFSSKDRIVSASLDGSIIVWDSRTGGQIERHDHPQSTGFRSVSTDTTGKIVAAGQILDFSKIYSGPCFAKAIHLRWHFYHPCPCILIATFNSGGDDDRCHIFSTSNPCFKLPPHPNTVFATDISSDGNLLAVGCSGEVLRVWSISSLANLTSGSSTLSEEPSLLFFKEEVHDLGILCCTFLPEENVKDRYTLITGGNDALIKVWRIGLSSSVEKKEMSLDQTLSEHSGPVMSLSFSPCGKHFASSSGDKTAKVWDSSTWQVILTLPQHSRYVTGCSLSLGSKYMATCCENYTQVWKLQLDQETQEGLRSLAADNEDEVVPEEFFCPITYDLMVNPVKCSDGFTYEESAIKEWLTTRRNTSPMTNLEIKVISLTPDAGLKEKIEEFRRGR